MRPRQTLAVAACALLAAVQTCAAQDAVAVTMKAAGAIPHEMSPWSMFLTADIVVKAIMSCLALASVATWTVFIAKTVEIARARKALLSGLGAVDNARSVAEARGLLEGRASVLGDFLAAAEHEERLSIAANAQARTLERAASRFAEIVRAEGRSIRRGMGVLATIGSTAPFVGLLGTVWGIMNSFIGISKSQTTNLAVVAPGIAEALLATAIGLVAAIPAVIIYNHFTRKSAAYLDIVGQASGAATRLLSRDLESGGAAKRAWPRAAE